MNPSTIRASRYLHFALLAILLSLTACKSNPPAPTPGPAPTPIAANAALSADDVSILFPVPTRAEDFANLIAVRDITTPNAQDPSKRDPVWSDAVFKQFLGIAASDQAMVVGTSARVGLPAEAQSIDNWFVAGIRIDAGAPGLSSDIHTQYGQLPEIRLIIQPVIKGSDGKPKVLDIAGHLIFDFVILPPPLPPPPDCFPRFAPDPASFNPVVADTLDLRNRLSNGQIAGHAVSTASLPLGVHPALKDPATANAFRNELLSFLEKHISAQRLGSMAIAGLPQGAPEPWIFLSMLGDRAGHFGPAHGPTLDGTTQFAQMLSRGVGGFRVAPEPHTNNLNPITCKNAAVSPTSLPIAQRNGVSTSTVFAAPPSADQTKQILDTIADPTKSFFFNTDCISCHTETRLTMDVLKVKEIPGIDTAVLPKDPWDVRNFGWGAAGPLAGMQATVTRRTANETAAVLQVLNAHP